VVVTKTSGTNIQKIQVPNTTVTTDILGAGLPYTKDGAVSANQK